jgi:PAS domain S-box-containing protein
MTIATALDHVAVTATPAAVPAHTELPLRTTDFDAGLAGLYHGALQGMAHADLLDELCQHVARLLRLRLAVVARRLDTGAMAIEAASSENGLWLELQRIPERWDGGLSSGGPAGAALRAGAPMHLHLDDDGFRLWRAAAAAEHVTDMLAIPLARPDGARVLELYFDQPLPRGASKGTLTIAGLAHAMETFLADVAAIERRELLADALVSAGNAAMITDLEGTIVWTNAAFTALSGYAAAEVVGRNPNLLSSGHQGVRYYRDLWATIRAGKVWSGETVDRAKDGRAYTIQQTVSPVAQDGRITHYLSVQQDIGRQKQERTQLELASRVNPDTGLLTAAAFEIAARAALGEADAPARALVIVSLRGVQRALPTLHEGAERALAQMLGQRIGQRVAPPDLAGALGPFEYALLLRNGPDDAPLRARLQSLADSLKEPFAGAATLPSCDPHFGVAQFPAEGTTLPELRRKADRRLADEPYGPARRAASH